MEEKAIKEMNQEEVEKRIMEEISIPILSTITKDVLRNKDKVVELENKLAAYKILMESLIDNRDLEKFEIICIETTKDLKRKILEKIIHDVDFTVPDIKDPSCPMIPQNDLLENLRKQLEEIQ